MKLRFLGTSAAMPSATRSHVSFVLWADRPFLVECGPTVPWQLVRAGLDHRAIGDVLVTHVHGDHSLGLPMLLTLGQLDGRDWPLRVYCPTSAIDRLKAICVACYPSLRDFVENRVIWVGLSEDGLATRELSDATRLVSVPGIHSAPEVALRFESAGRVLVYSGDTAPAPAISALARGAGLLLHEATWSETIDGRSSADHTTAGQAGRLAAEAGVRRLALVHLHKNYAGQEQALLAEAAENFDGEILLPNDSEELDV